MVMQKITLFLLVISLLPSLKAEKLTTFQTTLGYSTMVASGVCARFLASDALALAKTAKEASHFHPFSLTPALGFISGAVALGGVYMAKNSLQAGYQAATKKDVAKQSTFPTKIASGMMSILLLGKTVDLVKNEPKLFKKPSALLAGSFLAGTLIEGYKAFQRTPVNEQEHNVIA